MDVAEKNETAYLNVTSVNHTSHLINSGNQKATEMRILWSMRFAILFENSI
jgi:hypothetical protein